MSNTSTGTGTSSQTLVAHIAGKYDKSLEELLKQLSHIDLTNDVYDQDPYLDAHGGYCDVFYAKSKKHGGKAVAVKRLRVHILHHKDVAKMLFRELTIWSSLDHKNVLPLLGYVMHGRYPALVSEWMADGTMRSYLDDHPDVSAMDMAKGIAAGLLHLHELHIIHSDLKSDNILMSEEGQPLLADFGISRIMSASLSVTTTTAAPKGSVRWMAVELLVVDLSDKQFGKPAVHTKMTDVWSYGMVVYELLTSHYPYAHLRHELQVSMAIINGQTPQKPKTLKNSEDDLLWLVCQKCWQITPSHRPDMSRLCNVLKHGTRTYNLVDSFSVECRSLLYRLQHFTLWDNPHREVVLEAPVPQMPGDVAETWRVIFSDVTLRCSRIGYRDKRNLYQVIQVESVDMTSTADGVERHELLFRPSATPERCFIPQYYCQPQKQRQSGAEHTKRKFKRPIAFEIVMPNGLLSLGVPIPDCLSGSSDLGQLLGGDKPISRTEAGELPDVIYICIGWPGYKPWKQEFVLRSKRDSGQDEAADAPVVTKAVIAKLSAKAVERFIESQKRVVPDLQGDDLRWRLGSGGIEASELVLCGLFDRSDGHWQASLRLDRPTFVSVTPHS